MITQYAPCLSQTWVVQGIPIGVQFKIGAGRGGGGCFPKNKLRNTNYGLFGGSGKEMKFRRRLYREVDKAKLGAGFFLEYSFISS